MREEEKARRDFEKAQKEAEKEEKLLQQAMKNAQEEIAKASEEERERYEIQLAELQTQLKEAEEKNQRAISMAQQTFAYLFFSLAPLARSFVHAHQCQLKNEHQTLEFFDNELEHLQPLWYKHDQYVVHHLHSTKA